MLNFQSQFRKRKEFLLKTENIFLDSDTERKMIAYFILESIPSYCMKCLQKEYFDDKTSLLYKNFSYCVYFYLECYLEDSYEIEAGVSFP